MVNNMDNRGAGLPEMPEEIFLAPPKKVIDWKRIFFILLGLGIFFLFYMIPTFPDAVDPGGKVFKLPWTGKMALGLFLMAGIWWVFEVMPIGATAIAIGLFQVLFYIRTANEALKDFLDPSVWFIFGSVIIGTAFTASGLTKRMAYKMLDVVGENTNFILLGTFLVTAAMTLLMAHTAVAAALFPLLMAINALYTDSDQPTKFGKGLFIGMAWAAGAGSIITFLGAARGVAAAGMFKEFTGQDIGFFELTWYMLPIGVLMVFIIWLIIIFFSSPSGPASKDCEKAKALAKELGPMNPQEKFVILAMVTIIALVHAQVLCTLENLPGPGPGRHHAHRHRGLLYDPGADRGKPGDRALEHHPALRRRHVHRLLPVEDRRGPMAGGALAHHVPQGPAPGVHPGHRLLRSVYDQLHHERGGHRHLAARVSGHRQIPGGGGPRDSLCFSGGGRHALQPAHRRRAQRHRL
jgi:hypothetical protein